MILVAGVSASRLANEIGSRSQMTVGTHMEDGGGLKPNQYILTWYDPFGSTAMTRYMEKGWEFVIPVLCQEKGVWVKINKHMAPSAARHCMLVTCESTGAVNFIASDTCPKGTLSNDIWDQDRPHRVLDTNDAKVALNGYVFKGPRSGPPPEKNGYKKSLMDLSKTMSTDRGWEFDMKNFPAGSTPDFKEWIPRSPNCRDDLQGWSSYGVVPRNESSLTECKLKRDEKMLTCQAGWTSKIGTQTAWQWKEFGPVSDMEGLKRVFPYCTKWCQKESCYTKPVPESVTRDEAAFMKVFNSNKKDCEDELDAYAKKRQHKCETIEGLFCFQSWEEFHPCAMTYTLPTEPEAS